MYHHDPRNLQLTKKDSQNSSYKSNDLMKYPYDQYLIQTPPSPYPQAMNYTTDYMSKSPYYPIPEQMGRGPIYGVKTIDSSKDLY